MANDNRVQKTDAPPVALQKLLTAHKANLQKALAKHMDPDRLIRIAVSAMHRQPTLQNCSIQSIVNSVVLSGVLGLEPNTPLGHAYLIPYGKECTFQPGYRGLMHLAIKSGSVKRFSPALVFEGDEFEQELGMNEKFRHVPMQQSDEWLGAYSFARTPDGEYTWLYLPKANILHIRDTFSQSYKTQKTSPWITSEDEMALKTAIKRHIKRLDVTIEVARAADLDDQADKDGKQESFIDIEFQELAKSSEEADLITQGSRQKQEDAKEDKLAELKQQPKVETPEEEMDRLTREAAAAEAAAAEARAAEKPKEKPALQFGRGR